MLLKGRLYEFGGCMSLAVVRTRALVGINAPLVSVEVHLANGLPSFNIVGLPETSVKESRDRVRSAIINSHFEFPAKRITVNLAPADLPKEGGRFDLAIAVGIIVASLKQKPDKLENLEFVGELALSGKLRGVRGGLSIALASKLADCELVLPKENVAEAALVSNQVLLPANSLVEVYKHLLGEENIQHYEQVKSPVVVDKINSDMTDIIGQESAKRALLIAAAGRHNILFCGPPGTGKTMLASRILGLLPPLNEQEGLESAAIRSISDKGFRPESWRVPPFRSPHHSSSAVALVGGGSTPKPGEISLAHNGVLFLDELPEFPRNVLDGLREPLESREVHISRANKRACFPANFQLIAALNPSPSGDLYDGRHDSRQILRYLNRISGPLLDRIDLQVEVPRLEPEMLHKLKQLPRQSSAQLREKVVQAREIQLQRNGKLNSELTNSEVETLCVLTPKAERFIRQAANQLKLSMRALNRALKTARTIADLNAEEHIQQSHIAEALSYRALERMFSELV